MPIACIRSRGSTFDEIGALTSRDRPHTSTAAKIFLQAEPFCDTIIVNDSQVKADESSRDFLDSIAGVYRIPPDRPRLAHIQQPLDHGRVSWSFDRISSCFDVRPSRKAPTKTRFYCSVVSANTAGLGNSHRSSPFPPEGKRLIPKVS